MTPAEIRTSSKGGERSDIPSSDRFRYVETPWGLQKLRISSNREIKADDEGTDVADDGGVLEMSEGNAGDDDDDCERLPAKSILDKVLPFQRWRDFRLKNMFISELKKVLEEARHDEADMVSMEWELASKERDLQEALAVAAQLRVELAVSKQVTESCNAVSGLKELQTEKEKALLRAARSEEEVLKRDKEIARLEEKLKFLENGGRKTEELKTIGILLPPSKEGDLSENWIDPKDQEGREEDGGLQSAVSQVSTEGLSPEKELDSSEIKGNSEASLQMDLEELQDLIVQGLQALHSQDSHRLLSIQHRNTSGSDVVGADAFLPTESIKSEGLQTRDVDADAFVVKSEGPYFNVDKVESLKLSSSVVWKWRWAAAASRLKLTLDRINDSDSSSEAHQSARGHHDGSLAEIKTGKLIVGLAKKDLTESIPACRMPRIVFSLWRACTKVSRLERKTNMRTVLADKFMAALPWWFRKIGERRRLERIFMHWLAETLRSKEKRKSMKREICMYDSFRHCCLKKRPDSSQSSKLVSYNSDPIQELNLLPSAYEESPRSGGSWYWNPKSGHRSPPRNSSKTGSYVECAKSNNSGTYVGYATRQVGGWQENNFGEKLSNRGLHALQASLQMELEELQDLIVQGLQALHSQASKKRANPNRMEINWSCESKRSIVYLLEFLQKLGHVITEVCNQINAFTSDSNSVLHSKKIHQGLLEMGEKSQYRNKRDDMYCKSKDHDNTHALLEISQDCNLTVGMKKRQPHENIVCTAAKNPACKSSGCTKRRICLAAQYAALLKNEMIGLKEGNLFEGASIEKKLDSKKKGHRGP